MEEKSYSISYQEGKDWSVLSDSHQRLILSAIAAAAHAYAPYSNFKVGAAMLTDGGTIISGNNQENAAYPMCNCAEQVTIQKAFSSDPNVKPRLFAIYADNGRSDTLAAPCGACRQVLSETVDRTQEAFPIILVAEDRSFKLFYSAHDLLPFGFGGKDLS